MNADELRYRTRVRSFSGVCDGTAASRGVFRYVRLSDFSSNGGERKGRARSADEHFEPFCRYATISEVKTYSRRKLALGKAEHKGYTPFTEIYVAHVTGTNVALKTYPLFSRSNNKQLHN